nr:immunoglobulin light chain junction region [Macaca mulatta]MOV95569.1 immunoglobulin light chain junction region [Macaca mulatta]MOV95628.1 immunoglobulin light chain junction region [Macaca mulatta]MOV95916.1 immunoglobulin light chain junction region [Macaca mulatta]MOV95932.1 immunoglobulin light chain junction region [Macaca mulatta]
DYYCLSYDNSLSGWVF